MLSVSIRCQISVDKILKLLAISTKYLVKYFWEITTKLKHWKMIVLMLIKL